MLATLLVSLAIPASAEVAEIRVEPRTLLPTIVITPPGEDAKTRRSELVAAIAALVEDQTGLEMRLVDQASGLECKGRLACLFERALEDLPSPRPPLLLIVSRLGGGTTSDRMSALLLDVGGAADGEVSESILVRAPSVDVPDRKSADAYLRRLFEEHLAGELVRRDWWRPFGAIEIDASDGVQVEIDGVVAAEISAGRTRLVDVRAGSRKLRATRDGFTTFERVVDVGARRAVSVRVEVARIGSRPSDVAHTIALYGGTGLAVAGAVFGVVGAAAGVKPETTFCVGSDPNCSGRYTRLGGVPVLPVTVATILTGGVVAGGSLLESEDRIPWWSFAIGIAAGVASYVVLSLAEPSSMP